MADLKSNLPGDFFGKKLPVLAEKRARLKLGLIGFVLHNRSLFVVRCYNPLLRQNLRSFEHPVNWVCFGFVFRDCENVISFIILC